MVAQEFLVTTKNLEEKWWMFVDLFKHRTVWSYVAEFCYSCDDFVEGTKLEDSQGTVVNEPTDMEARTEAQVRLLGATSWFATVLWSTKPSNLLSRILRTVERSIILCETSAPLLIPSTTTCVRGIKRMVRLFQAVRLSSCLWGIKHLPRVVWPFDGFDEASSI